MQKEYKLYVNGAWIPTVSGSIEDDINPADGSLVARIHMAGPMEAEAALAAAQNAKTFWGNTLPEQRERLLLRAADIFERRVEELTELIVLESGSARFKARGGVIGSAGILRVAAGECRKSGR